MSSLVCWLGVDSRGPASLYIATDSRVSGLGSVTSESSGRWDAGQKYQVTFWSATRDGNGGNTPCAMTVTANGTTIYGPFTPTSDFNWNQYTTNTFTATSSSYTFVFQTSVPGYDASDLLDDVHLVQVE